MSPHMYLTQKLKLLITHNKYPWTVLSLAYRPVVIEQLASIIKYGST